ncbi:MAG TPA: aspartyl protease family protein [Armatimonadota bacterium]|nr:aspartyl protease family protein [Armatimonadota bacterium]
MSFHSARSICFLIVSTGLLLPVPRACSAVPTRRTTSAPIEFPRGSILPVITARIKGINARLLLDTGTNAVVVSEAFVKRAGLDTRTVELPPAKRPVQNAAKIAHLPYMDVGGWRLPGFDSNVVSSVPTPGDSGPVDGILGWPIFQQYAGLIDFGARRLTLWYPSGLSPAEIKAAGMDAAKPVPLVAAPDHYCHVAIKIGSSTFEVRLDTGSEATTLAPAAAAELKLRPLAQGTILGFNRFPTGVNLTRCPGISVGGVHFGPCVVDYPVLSHGAVAPALGMNLLRNARILIDPGARQIRFALPPAAPSAEIVADWSVYRAPMRLVGEDRIPVIGVELPDHKLHWFGFTFNRPSAVVSRIAATLGAPEQPGPGHPGVKDFKADLGIGGHAIRNVRLLALSSAELDPEGDGIEGVIGYTLLETMAVNIDPSRSLAEVILPGPAGFLLPPPPAGEAPVGIAPGAYGAWYVKASLDDTSVNASPDLHDRLILDSVGTGGRAPQPARQFSLRSQTSRLMAGRFRSLRVGDVTLRSPEVVEVSDSDQVYFSLGLDFFRGRSLYLDAPIGAIYMTQKAPISPPALDEYQGTGIESLRHHGTDIYVRAVLDPSPASEANIQAGDQILAVDGIAPSKLPPLKLGRELWVPDGKTVVLKIKKKDQPQPVEVKLVRRKLL